MPSLPLALAAFALGALLLQWQPVLPHAGAWLAAGAACAAAGALIRLLAPSAVASRIVAGALAIAAAGAIGFGYAAWRAEVRLADALPSQWEGVDIALVGVVDDLPQSSARGTRFAFAVERVETPERDRSRNGCRSPGTRSAARAATSTTFRRSPPASAGSSSSA